MKRLLFLLTILSITACSKDTAQAQTEKTGTTTSGTTSTTESLDCPLGSDYKLVWNDEFEGDSLDLSKWTVEVKPQGWVNNELQNYVNQFDPNGSRTILVSNGTLKIIARQYNGKVYSGRIYGNMKQGWKYGYVQACIKLPSGKGTWPAFWMMPVNYTSWPDDGEIDIMEEVGVDKDQVVSTIHCNAYNHVKGTQKTETKSVEGAEGSFHVYGLEWTENKIQTYVDGEPILTFVNDCKNDKDTWPFNAPFYVILNLAWGGDWGGYAGVDVMALPATMEVKYVRVWSK